MSSSSTITSSGVSAVELLTIVFICAKLFGIEPISAWSWFWVFSPLWMYGAGVMICLVIAFIVFWVKE